MKETKQHREEREYIEQLFQQVKREAQQAGILFSSHISGIIINRRARKRFGCCKAVKSFAGYTSYQIEVSEKVLICDEKKIKQTIAHELIHTCKGCMNHGERWKHYAMIMNRRYGYEIKRTATDEEMGVYTSSSSEKLNGNPDASCSDVRASPFSINDLSCVILYGSNKLINSVFCSFRSVVTL